MSTPAHNGQTPPGWYPNPNTGTVGYWDGQVWSTPAPTAQTYGATPYGHSAPGAGYWPSAAAAPVLPPDLAGAPLGPVHAVKSGFQNMFTMRGRASRSAYWWFAGFQVLYAIVLLFLVSAVIFGVDPYADPDAVTGLWLLACLPVFIASFTLLARRLHDTNRSAHFLWFYLLPYVGSFVLFVLALLDPKEPNRFAARAGATYGGYGHQGLAGYSAQGYGQNPYAPHPPTHTSYGRQDGTSSWTQ